MSTCNNTCRPNIRALHNARAYVVQCDTCGHAANIAVMGGDDDDSITMERAWRWWHDEQLTKEKRT